MGQESSRGPKKVARGVQKVPKGFQKVAKSHEKDIQKASTRHPNAISKCIGNSIGNSISNAIANAIATAIGNRSPRHGGGKAEGNWIHKQVEFKEEMAALWCLLEAFWHLLDALGDFFLEPGTTPGPFRPRGAKRCEKVTNWLNFGGSRGAHFETILVKLMTF